MATVSTETPGPGDEELIDSVRHGSTGAFGELYQRHVAAAYNLARQLARSPAEADDLVSDAFAKVLDTLRGGRGPDVAFRAYLLTTLRHNAYDKTRKDRKVELSEDVTAVNGVDTAKVSVPFSDTAVEGLERSLAARAFATLPERWQAVLWHTEIEGQPPAEVAPLLGISANGVSALAYRAREGLRQAYLQVHLAETGAQRCRSTVDRLGAWTRGGLARREKAQVEAHLDECESCRALAAELAEVNGALRVILAPVVLGAAAGGYLAATGAASGGTVAAAGVATAGAGSAGGAAGALSSAPRQLLGVGASAAALAAAVALAAVAPAGNQRIPTAQVAPSPPPRSAPQAPPAPQQPPKAPQPPAPKQAQPPQKHAPAPHRPAPAPTTPAPTPAPTTTSPPPSPTPTSPPAPAPPSLTASSSSTSSNPITVTTNGTAQVPVTVTNSGTAQAGPVRATLGLPPGMHLGHHPARKVQPKAYSMPMAASAGHRRRECPVDSLTCTSRRGLAPGASVTLFFRLQVADSTDPGTYTFTGSVALVDGGASAPISVTVKVQKCRCKHHGPPGRPIAPVPTHHPEPIAPPTETHGPGPR